MGRVSSVSVTGHKIGTVTHFTHNLSSLVQLHIRSEEGGVMGESSSRLGHGGETKRRDGEKRRKGGRVSEGEGGRSEAGSCLKELYFWL